MGELENQLFQTFTLIANFRAMVKNIHIGILYLLIYKNIHRIMDLLVGII